MQVAGAEGILRGLCIQRSKEEEAPLWLRSVKKASVAGAQKLKWQMAEETGEGIKILADPCVMMLIFSLKSLSGVDCVCV